MWLLQTDKSLYHFHKDTVTQILLTCTTRVGHLQNSIHNVPYKFIKNPIMDIRLTF